MRRAYTEEAERKRKSSFGINNAYNYSYLKVGEQMHRALLDEDSSNLFNEDNKIREKHTIPW